MSGRDGIAGRLEFRRWRTSQTSHSDVATGARRPNTALRLQLSPDLDEVKNVVPGDDPHQLALVGKNGKPPRSGC